MATDQDTHDQDVTYAPMADVARAYGVSVDTIRRRLRKGELQGRKEQTPSGFKWLVEMPSPGAVLPGHEPTDPPARVHEHEAVTILQHELQARAAEIERLHDVIRTQAQALEAMSSTISTPALPAPRRSVWERIKDVFRGDAPQS